jgi:hypothetical protein
MQQYVKVRACGLFAIQNRLRAHLEECRYQETVHGSTVPLLSDALRKISHFMTKMLFVKQRISRKRIRDMLHVGWLTEGWTMHPTTARLVKRINLGVIRHPTSVVEHPQTQIWSFRHLRVMRDTMPMRCRTRYLLDRLGQTLSASSPRLDPDEHLLLFPR